MVIRMYGRRSKNDAGKQEFSLDVQDAGCRAWARTHAPDAPIVAYVDDGIAGDDFAAREDLHRLIREAQPGDVVVARDQSRLGRDALEVTLVIRQLVRDRECRLVYYATGQDVRMDNAMDQASVFIQGTGHQMELEAIRGRTREALVGRVQRGHVAGGRCYGYRQERIADGSGRSYTIATVDEEQAAIVRQIFAWRVEGWGFKRIARTLNSRGIPFPEVSRRSNGTWSPCAVRAMLRNERYKGLHVYGRRKKVRRAGQVVRLKAAPTEVLTIERPEWRIVEEGVWTAAQETFLPRAPDAPPTDRRAKYALSARGRCECGGRIGVASTHRNGKRIPAYCCVRHRERGPAVCTVGIYQPIEQVERALVAYVADHVLTPAIIEAMSTEIRAGIEAQLPERDADVSTLEAELRQVRAEHARLSRAVALSDDVDALVVELNARSARARALEVQIGTIRHAPAELRSLVDQAEATVKERLGNLRDALLDGADLRLLFGRLFPSGLIFSPAEVGRRQCWRIKGAAHLGELAASPADPWFSLGDTPAEPPLRAP